MNLSKFTESKEQQQQVPAQADSDFDSIFRQIAIALQPGSRLSRYRLLLVRRTPSTADILEKNRRASGASIINGTITFRYQHFFTMLLQDPSLLVMLKGMVLGGKVYGVGKLYAEEHIKLHEQKNWARKKINVLPKDSPDSGAQD